MSLYNMLMGYNPTAPFLISLLGIPVDEVNQRIPRFRDCYLHGDQIVLFTRTGGGNREFYESDQCERDVEYSGPTNEDLRAIPGYVRDEDDSFDETYAHFYYDVPEDVLAAIKILKDLGAEREPMKAFRGLIEKLNDPTKKDDPDVQRAMNVSRPLIEKLEEALRETDTK